MIPDFPENLTFARCNLANPTVFECIADMEKIPPIYESFSLIQQADSTAFSAVLGIRKPLGNIKVFEVPVFQTKEKALPPTKMEISTTKAVFPNFPRYHPIYQGGYLNISFNGMIGCTKESIFSQNGENEEDSP